MKIEELKNKIESGAKFEDFLIFELSDNDFIAMQYIKEIARQRNLDIEFSYSIESLMQSTLDIFSLDSSEDVLTVIRVDEIKEKIVRQPNNTFVLCKKCSKELKDFCVKVPKLEKWQIKDYVYEQCEGISEKNLDWLLDACHYDIYRLEQEVSKIRIFPPKERKYLFDDFILDGIYSDLSTNGIFDLSNAIQNRDLEKVKSILKDMITAKNAVNIDSFGLLAVLLNTFTNLIKVWLSKYPTEESIGLKSNQIWAINKLRRTYSKEQLIKIYNFLTDIDRQIKVGELPTEIMTDYIVLKVLSI